MDLLDSRPPEKTTETSTSPSASDESSAPKTTAYARLNRRCDFYLLPPLFLVWFFPFIDRVNIGNARIQGLEHDLHLTGSQFNVVLVVFFVSFIIFEVPSNLAMRRISPRIWLSSQVVLLGLFTACQGLVHTYAQLIAMRVFVGVFEAGLIPGSVFLLAAYYPRFQLQWRLSLLNISTALASAFGGLLAYAIAGMSGTRGYLGWRWIFIIEGAISIGLGLICFFTVPSWPSTASFLTEEDRVLLRQRLHDGAEVAKMDRMDGKAIKRCLTDWKIWLSIPIYIGTCATTYSINLFGPTFVQTLYPHYSPRHVQILVVPILILSGLVSLTTAYFSDRLQHRVSFAQFGYLLSFIGFVLLLKQEELPKGVRYAALYFVEVGSYISLPLLWSVMANNVSGSYKRAIATGLQIGVGQFGGVITSLVFPAKEAPLYRKGFEICLSLLITAAVLMMGFVLGLWIENRKRNRGERDYRLSLEAKERENLGDDHPSFRFVY